MDKFLAVCIALLFAGLFVIIGLKIREMVLFKKDPNNPYRRYCKKCGQRQEEHGTHYHDPRGWWENNGKTYDPHCCCHFYSANN